MIHAYDKSYLSAAQKNLARMLDYLVNDLHYPLETAWQWFVTSELSARFEQGDCSVLVGLSGVELARAVLEQAGEAAPMQKTSYAYDRSPEYWTGWALAYYQWLTSLRFAEIEQAVSITKVRLLYTPYHEMDVRQFADKMNELYRAAKPETNLKAMRTLAGFLITENRFAECKNAIVKLCSRATLSNCQFIDCAGKDLVTSRWNSQVTIQDCEFSNISLSPVNSVEEIEQIGELCLKNYIRELIPGKFSTLDTKGVLIEIGGVDKKFANSNRPSKIERCIFNGVHICSEGGFACNMGKWKACKADRNLTKDQMNFLISVYTANYDKFNYPRVIVSDCTFKNCASVHQEIINTEPYDSVFGSRHNYTAISVRNNYGLDNIGDPTSYVKSSDVKLKEIDANGNKIGSSLSVN